MQLNEIKKLIEDQIDTFLSAGKLSLDLRKKGLIKKTKEDNTPVSNGDIEINNIIINKLTQLTPTLPIVSEELSDNKNLTDLQNFWLVDPIDGTYDYINDLDEFTLNVALIINKRPVAGIIYAPAKKRMFYSHGIDEAYELYDTNLKKLNCKKLTDIGSVKMVSYSDNLKPEIKKIHDSLGVTEFVKMKSSLKFCVIAAGEFDGYVAEPRACEWDIAAGHAILINSGGLITDFNGNEILYGKKGFKNTSLIVKRNKIL